MNKQQVKEYMAGMFDFYPKNYQLDFATSCMTKDETVAVFCRQSGKSETTSKVAIMLCRQLRTVNPVLIFAPTDRQVQLIAAKIKRALKSMPYMSHFHVIRETQREFYFFNEGVESCIICQTTGHDGETILGFTAGAIILEEAGSIKDSIVHGAIFPMGNTTDPPIIKIGTPKGKNHFYESYDEGKREGTVAVHQIDWRTAVKEGIVKQKFVDKEMKRLTSDKIKTELEAQFIEDQDAYFGYELIDNCVRDYEYDDYEPEENATYFMGCDIARLGQDRTVFIIFKQAENENEAHYVVGIYAYDKTKLDFVVDEINRLDDKFEFAKIYVDETGLGAGVVDFLSRQHNINKTRRDKVSAFQKNYTSRDKIVGITFSMKSKLDIYSNLKNLMEQDSIIIPKHRMLISELRDFRYELTENQNVKLHHSEHGNDDYTDALALAARGLNIGEAIIDMGEDDDSEYDEDDV